MCMGSPRPPRIVQQGPSRAQIQAQEAQLQAYQQQATAQSEAFQRQLQAQIDEVAAQTQQAQAQAAAMASAASTIVQGGYEVATAQQAAVGAQTTETMQRQQANRSSSSLRISPAGTAASAGTGLNIGI
jgi:hypothetical protein